MTWPWPADTALARARRVARSYRDALEATDPAVCAYLDAEMDRFGQRWVLDLYATYQEHDLLSAELVADYAQVRRKTVYEWARRGLDAVQTPDGKRWRFRDVQRWVGGSRGR